MFQFLMLSGLLSGILAYFVRSKQFFPEFLPNFLTAFLFIWLCLAFLKFIYSLYSKYSEEIDHEKVFWFLLLSSLLSGILAYFVRSKQFFPEFLPNFLTAFLFVWFCLAFLKLIYNLYSKYSEEIDHEKVFWYLLLSSLLSGVLAYFVRSKQFFPEFLPNFLTAFLFVWFCLAFLKLIYNLYSKYSEEINHSKVFWFLLLSGLLSYLLAIYARSKQFFPNFLPNFSPERNLQNVFLFNWFCLMFLGFIYSLIRLCCSSENDSSSRGESDYPLLDDEYDDYHFDYYDYARAQNHIAHRADAYNPFSNRFNPSSQYESGGRTARWSHQRASRNNEIVRNWFNFV